MRPGQISAVIYTTIAIAASALFVAVTVIDEDYSWVARVGGASWVFLLSMIILMPTVTPWVKGKLMRDTPDGERGRKLVRTSQPQ